MRFVFARADHVVANSTFVAERVRRMGLAQGPLVVWPGVDERPSEPAPSATPSVVFVGRLIPRKGVDRLIDACALVRDRRLALWIVGDGPQRAALEALAFERGLAGRVRFLGAADDAARDRALAQAWCFAMPARAEGGDVEGFGIAYLEAAMAGLPSIGGRGSGADDAIVDGETGLLVDGTDVAAIAAAIERLIDDRAAAAAMGAAARARALRSFSWQANARAIARHLALPASA
jgi:phosphatidylinositol alpha-1,6-mannosyltransferase